MSPTEFQKIESSLGLKPSDFREALGGYDRQQIYHWRSGRRKIPRAVAALMRNLEEQAKRRKRNG